MKSYLKNFPHFTILVACEKMWCCIISRYILLWCQMWAQNDKWSPLYAHRYKWKWKCSYVVEQGWIANVWKGTLNTALAWPNLKHIFLFVIAKNVKSHICFVSVSLKYKNIQPVHNMFVNLLALQIAMHNTYVSSLELAALRFAWEGQTTFSSLAELRNQAEYENMTFVLGCGCDWDELCKEWQWLENSAPCQMPKADLQTFNLRRANKNFEVWSDWRYLCRQTSISKCVADCANFCLRDAGKREASNWAT